MLLSKQGSCVVVGICCAGPNHGPCRNGKGGCYAASKVREGSVSARGREGKEMQATPRARFSDSRADVTRIRRRGAQTPDSHHGFRLGKNPSGRAGNSSIERPLLEGERHATQSDNKPPRRSSEAQLPRSTKWSRSRRESFYVSFWREFLRPTLFNFQFSIFNSAHSFLVVHMAPASVAKSAQPRRRGNPGICWSRRSRKALFRSYLFMPAKLVPTHDITRQLLKVEVQAR
jgi:hypothetical protein